MSYTYVPNKMFFLKLSIFVFCVILIKAEEDCPYMKACLEETEGKVTSDDIKKIHSIRKEAEIDNVPTGVLCVLQCVLKKRGVLEGEMIDPKKLIADEKLMKRIRDREPFVECVEKIEFKECDDMKKYIKCMMKYFKYD
ncbi:hypothetical protein WA026_016785 [Henosepilachna vigintioctopunctata]|uniref:Uncharacterized protein n=1 Tax=Henosepilachna vigintioctopunctata TaxID=420089 RepID=A0AAW1V2Q7_9CUCU